MTGWLALAALPGQAATLTWLGDNPEFDDNWTTDENWYGTAAPSPGDSLVFGFSKQNNNNDFPANTLFRSITFTNDGWDLGGQALSLTNAGVAVLWNQPDIPSSFNLLEMPVTFVNAATISNATPPGALIFSGPVANGGNLLTVGTVAGGTVILNGRVTGAGGLRKTGGGALQLGSGANDYAGDTTIAEGTLVLGANSVLPSGSNAGNVVVNGTLDLNGMSALMNGLSGSGFITNSSGAMANLNVCSKDVGTTFTFDGYIQGAVHLSKLQALPTLVLTRPNTYTGNTGLRRGTLRLGTDNALPVTTVLTIGTNADTATFDLGGYNQQLAGLAKGTTDGCIITNSGGSDSTLTFSNMLVPSTYLGRIVDGPGGRVNVTVAGGTLTLDQLTSRYRGLTLVTNGGSTLIVSTAQRGGGPFSVADDANLEVTVATTNDTLNMSSLALGTSPAHNGTLEIDLGDFGIPTTAPITATNLSANGTVTINVDSSRVRLGRFPLIQYSGAIGGAGYGAFALGSLPPGVTAQLVNNTNNTSVDLHITAYVGSLVWRGETNGVLASDWNVGLTTNWTDLATGVPTAYSESGPSGQIVLFDDSASNVVVNVTAAVRPFSVTISNAASSYSIGGTGSIAGAGSLVKQGDGSLTLTSANSYSGDTVISAGTLVAGANGAIPYGIGNGNVSVNGTLDVAGTFTRINGLSGNGLVDNSAGTGTLGVGHNDQTSTFGGMIQNTGGTLAVNKVGAGTLTLSGTNTYSGATKVLAGTLAITTAGQPAGLLTVSNGASLSVTVSSAGSTLKTSSLVLGSGGSDATTNNFDLGVFGNPANPVIYATNLTVYGTNTINLDGSGFTLGRFALIQYEGPIGGDGYSFTLGSLPPGLGAYLSNAPGAVQLVITNPAYLVWTGSHNTNWDIDTTVNWQLIGVPTVYEDGSTVLFDSRGALRNHVYLTTDVAPGDLTVRDPANDYTFSGPGRLTGPGGLTKTGAGTLTLNTSNLFTGNTMVNGGQLKLGANGSIAGSASIVVVSNALLDVSAVSGGWTLGSNNALGGYGTITGAVTVAQGATLAPGTAPGILAFQNNLNLQGTVAMQTWKTGAALSSTKLAVGGVLTYGGASTLTVAHNGDPLRGGEVFDLFDAGTFNGAFYSWNLPSLGAGLNWCLNQLTTDGTLSVNRAPVAGNVMAQTTPGIPLYFKVADLLSVCSDPDNDPLTLASVGSAAQGTANLDSDGATLIYIPAAAYTGLDEFTYTISDGRGGMATGTNWVQVASPGASVLNRFSIPAPVGGNVAVNFAGVPGDYYMIQRSTNLVDWTTILEAAIPDSGLLSFHDTSLPSPPPKEVFYRAVFELGTAESTAAQILQAAGVKGGFVGHIGCGNGRLTAALRQNGSYMVQGLDRDPAQVAAARTYIGSLGIYGPVSADQWDGAHLPYIDNFVNLLVVQDMGAMTSNEIKRVLAPLGVAYVQQGGSWIKTVKPRPPDIDDWTHYAHDATGSCVAQDTVVGPPKRYQWLAGPRFNRHHDVMSSFNAGVSANGRLFHVMDEGSRESILLPGKWSLIARDGFNGTLLWKRSISSWHPSLYGLKSGPAQLPRRLVAVGDVVYVTLDYYGPVTALDAATGATLQTYTPTAAAQEIYWSQGTLFVLVDPTPKQWAIWEDYYNTQICQKTPSTWWSDHPRILTAINPTNGVVLWAVKTYVYPTSIAVDSTGVVYHDGANIVKRDRNSGALLWTSSQPVSVLNPTFTANGLSMILYKSTVLMTGGPGGTGTDPSQNQNGLVWSVDSASGLVLTNWTHGKNSHLHSPNDLFVLDDLVWSTAAGSTNPVCTGYNRTNGAPVRIIDPHIYIDWIHERCYRSKATVNYFLTSRACLEVINTQTNWGLANDWVRAACLYGFIPCNGLIYTTPNDCSCQFEAKLTGLGALAPASADTNYPPTEPDAIRLQPGPAYGQAVLANPSPDDWPIYRHDQVRSGYTSNEVPAALNLGWQTTLGGKLSSVTVAEGKLFVASVDTHTVYALDAASGTNIWSYTVGGRVDSPPTIYQGRVLFGSADGYVYCLRATDGALIWRFLGAPTDLRHMSYEQLESVWPVSGSVLVLNDKVYCVSGRSMYLDDGCRFLALNSTNGVKLIEQVMNDKVPGTTNSLTSLEKNFNGPVALADLLSSDGQHVFMKSQWFDLNGVRTNIGPLTASGAVNVSWANQVGEGVHLFTPTGFLDDSWMHRTYWVWGKAWSSGAGAYFLAGKNAPCGQILCIDESNVYGFGRKLEYYKWTVPKENMLFSTSNSNNFYETDPYNWTNTLPFFVKAMVVSKDRLFLAGPPDLEDEEQAFRSLDSTQTQVVLTNQDAALNGAQGGQLRVVDKASGATLAMYNLNFLPVWDGMAAAQKSLYLATRDGRVICLR